MTCGVEPGARARFLGCRSPPIAAAAPAEAEDVEEEANHTWEVDAEGVRTALGELRG
jgi:hypothetical protein